MSIHIASGIYKYSLIGSDDLPNNTNTSPVPSGRDPGTKGILPRNLYSTNIYSDNNFVTYNMFIHSIVGYRMNELFGYYGLNYGSTYTSDIRHFINHISSDYSINLPYISWGYNQAGEYQRYLGLFYDFFESSSSGGTQINFENPTGGRAWLNITRGATYGVMQQAFNHLDSLSSQVYVHRHLNWPMRHTQWHSTNYSGVFNPGSFPFIQIDSSFPVGTISTPYFTDSTVRVKSSGIPVPSIPIDKLLMLEDLENLPTAWYSGVDIYHQQNGIPSDEYGTNVTMKAVNQLHHPHRIIDSFAIHQRLNGSGILLRSYGSPTSNMIEIKGNIPYLACNVHFGTLNKVIYRRGDPNQHFSSIGYPSKDIEVSITLNSESINLPELSGQFIIPSGFTTIPSGDWTPIGYIAEPRLEGVLYCAGKYQNVFQIESEGINRNRMFYSTESGLAIGPKWPPSNQNDMTIRTFYLTPNNSSVVLTIPREILPGANSSVLLYQQGASGIVSSAMRDDIHFGVRFSSCYSIRVPGPNPFHGRPIPSRMVMAGYLKNLEDLDISVSIDGIDIPVVNAPDVPSGEFMSSFLKPYFPPPSG